MESAGGAGGAGGAREALTDDEVKDVPTAAEVGPLADHEAVREHLEQELACEDDVARELQRRARVVGARLARARVATRVERIL